MTNLIVTAYCACSLCCGPGAPKPTASGTFPKEGVTCASNLYPFGTILEIEGVGRRIVEDRMARGKRGVDVFFKSHQAALAFGKSNLVVRVIGKCDERRSPPHRRRYLPR